MKITDKAVEAFIETYKLECDHRYDPDAIRAALTAALPHMGGVSDAKIRAELKRMAKAGELVLYEMADDRGLEIEEYVELITAILSALASHEPAPEPEVAEAIVTPALEQQMRDKDGPEVVAYLVDCPVQPVLEFADVLVPSAAQPLIRLSDYEALRAENERLRKQIEEWEEETARYFNVDFPYSGGQSNE